MSIQWEIIILQFLQMLDDKTMVINGDDSSNSAPLGSCPICGFSLSADESEPSIRRCQACGYFCKQKLSVEPGSVIANKYRILSNIGKGGFGSIFICHHIEDIQSRYVLKILRDASESMKKRFRREAKILSEIHSARITHIHDYWIDENDCFIVMEYVNGKNLAQLRQTYDFDEQAVLIIAKEVVTVLREIWENHSIIHRDIKPHNIMLDEESRVKILDFGLSKQLGNSRETTMDLTVGNESMGSPGFMSPEQYSNYRNTDFRTDIFSLGATLFFLLTGKQPFNGNNAAEVYADTLKNSPPSIEQMQGTCSENMMILLQNMMQKNPDDRYSDYTQLMNDIDIIASCEESE